MSNGSSRGANGAANAPALPLAWRVIGDLYERNDFQGETIDGLRDDLRFVMAERDRLREINDALNGRLEAALTVGEMNARSGASWAEGCEKAEAALAKIQDAANRAFVGISTGTVTREEAAAVLAPFVPVTEPVELPSGFVAINPADLPARLVEKVLARGVNAEGFVEVGADELPRDLFRKIFGLDRQPESAAEVNCFGEGCGQDCNDHGCARERAGAASETERAFTEAECYVIEAALHHGFDPADDECRRYVGTGDAILKLVGAAREQGQKDAVARLLTAAPAIAKVIQTGRFRDPVVAAKIVADHLKNALAEAAE